MYHYTEEQLESMKKVEATRASLFFDFSMVIEILLFF